jgi:hypothetical protein
LPPEEKGVLLFPVYNFDLTAQRYRHPSFIGNTTFMVFSHDNSRLQDKINFSSCFFTHLLQFIQKSQQGSVSKERHILIEKKWGGGGGGYVF